MQRNLISTKGLSRKDILAIFKRADELRSTKLQSEVNTSKLGGLLFFEASTRTRVGFEAAAWKLGINSVVIQETKLSQNMGQAESMRDTIRSLNPIVSFYCIRHPDEDIFNEVLNFTDLPVINCGNGFVEHPTQALITAYAIWHKFKTLDGLSITMIGELKYARAVHSLLLLLSKFSNVTINAVTPTLLNVQDEYKKVFEVNGNIFKLVKKHTWGNEDVVYSSGFPPKNPIGTFSQKERDKYKLSTQIAEKLSEDAIILNDLPRIDEIDLEVDNSTHAYYFMQNELGLYVRMAILQIFCY